MSFMFRVLLSICVVFFQWHFTDHFSIASSLFNKLTYLHIDATLSSCAYGDGDVISFHTCASWFSPPSCVGKTLINVSNCDIA